MKAGLKANNNDMNNSNNNSNNSNSSSSNDSNTYVRTHFPNIRPYVDNSGSFVYVPSSIWSRALVL